MNVSERKQVTESEPLTSFTDYTVNMIRCIGHVKQLQSYLSFRTCMCKLIIRLVW